MRSMAVLGMVIFCLVFVGSGCMSATTGNQGITQDNVSKIQKGVTTRDQVVAILGEPTNSQPLTDGRRMMLYFGTQQKADFGQRVFQAVPLVGVLVPTTDTKSVRRETLQIYLDSANVVQDYEFSDNTSETKTTESAFGGHAEETTTSNIPAK